MTALNSVNYYSSLEESINVISHSIGLVLSVVALFLLVLFAIYVGGVLHIASALIYGASLVVLYAASTAYHRARKPTLRARLRVFDHASIYVLIAGTYTPFALVSLGGGLGWLVFGLSWGLALVGVVLKLFFTGRFNLVSTLMYIFMGWLSLLIVRPLLDALSSSGLLWLVMGGVLYTVGAILYAIKKIPLNHAIFHCFVLLGSVSHFVSIFFYVS